MSLGIPSWHGTFNAGNVAPGGGLDFGGGNGGLPNLGGITSPNQIAPIGDGSLTSLLTFASGPEWWRNGAPNAPGTVETDRALFRNGAFGLEGYNNPNPALYNKLLRAESLLEHYWSTVIVGQLMTGSNGQLLIPPT
jgi:hypothetical protein